MARGSKSPKQTMQHVRGRSVTSKEAYVQNERAVRTRRNRSIVHGPGRTVSKDSGAPRLGHVLGLIYSEPERLRLARSYADAYNGKRTQHRFAHMCLLPSPFCSLHAREHHISPHFGHVGKFEPRFPHVAHAVCTRNIDERSKSSSTGWSVK